MRRLACVAVLALALGGFAGGCTPADGPVIEKVTESEETTPALTPLERGKVRREVLDHAREFIEVWTSADAEELGNVLPESVAKQFTDAWREYEADGLQIKHVHEVSKLDVTEINRDATQATVSYVYEDGSYLVDGSGSKARELEPVDASMTITLQRESVDSEWEVVRVFVKREGYR